MSEIKHWVQVIDGEVVHCWDSPPPNGVGVDGWREAIEVKPPIQPNRQGYTAHKFDITTDPVEIIWDVVDIGYGDRKSQLKGQAKVQFQQMVNRHMNLPSDFDLSLVADYQTKLNERLASIEKCQSHDDLDALPNWSEIDPFAPQ